MKHQGKLLKICCSVTDSDVQFSWCLTGISIEIEDERADTILEMYIKKWVTIYMNFHLPRIYSNSIIN